MASYLGLIRDAVWSTPDPLLRAAGMRGELLVARIRLVLSVGLILMPAIASILGTLGWETLVGLTATGCLVLYSLGAHYLIRRNHNCPWIGLVTGCFDVTLVSATLASFFFLGAPHTAVNSKVIFEGYFLAIAATTLRYDKRVCTVAGLLGLVQYLAIVLVAATQWDLNNDVYAPFVYGMFSWGAQISRLITMLVATGISLVVVVRTQQLLRLSSSDPLTGLFNRSYFGERVAAEVSRSDRSQSPMVIAMIDVDHFKEFNDRYGHAEGDRVLRAIGSILLRSFRKSDTVARYGGDEFVVAMPDTDILTARHKLEELRAVVAATSFSPRQNGEADDLALSAGIAGFPADGTAGDRLIDVADARLLDAKRNGRNHVVWEGPAHLPAAISGADR